MTVTENTGETDVARLEKAYRLIRAQKRRIAELEGTLREPVAVIGRACRVPGAGTLKLFHRLLLNGVDAIGTVPPDRWPGVRGVATLGGFVDQVDRLDPDFFGMTPREASRLDPQHALVLETGWTAIEDAGIDPLSLSGARVGVFLGISEGDHRQRTGEGQGFDIQSVTGGSSSVACARLSYLLGLQGPSLAIDTACSASLVAVHLAVRSLRAGECDMALAGGVNALLSPITTEAFASAGALAADGRCKAFDAAADGYVRSEGCGMVLLKPLSSARRDGDPVAAVVLGSAANQNGRTNGLMSPSGPAQQAVIRAALDDAGLTMSEIDYIETHGTGTALGDPIEIGALGAVFAGRDRPLTIGSVKSNVGHLEGAAGVVGLLKAAHVVETGVVPRNLHFSNPNPHADWAAVPIRVVSRPETLPPGARAVGVSSFGFSGTNAHVILARPPAEAATVKKAHDGHEVSELHLLKIAARSPTALRAAAAQHADLLMQTAPDMLDAYCRTAALGRSDFPERLCVLAESPEAMAKKLNLHLDGKRSPEVVAGTARKALSIAFLATGQGAERPAAARELFELAPAFRSALLKCEEILAADGVLSEPLRDVLFSSDGTLLRRTAYAQPIMFALSWSMARFWHSLGIEPQVLIGHSTGEYAAACIAGCFSLEDGLGMIARRARLIEEATRGGATAAIFAGPEDVTEVLRGLSGEVSISGFNAPRETLVAGREAAVEAVLARAGERGWRGRKLALPYAPHSPMIAPVIERFREEIGAVSFQAPDRTLVSNVTGDVVERIDADYFCRHLREPVRFASGVKRLEEMDCGILLEIGPEPVLQLLARQNWTGGAVLWATSLWSARSDRRQVLETVAQLYTHGAPIRWQGVVESFSRTQARISLPSYPFDALPPKDTSDSVAVQLVLRDTGVSAADDPAAVLVSILAGLMERRPQDVDRRASFVELGADSLLLGRLALDVAELFGIDVTIGALFDELNSVERLAGYLTERDAVAVPRERERRPELPRQPASASPATPRRGGVPQRAPVPAMPDGPGGERTGRPLSPSQLAHVDDLVQRFRAKTSRSAERYRCGRERRVDTRVARVYPPELEGALYPIVGESAAGARLTDIDGNRYVDVTMGIGSLLCGHSPDFIRAAQIAQIEKGVQNGPLAELADDVAERLAALTGHERVLFGLSGTASVMNALRLARAATGRQRIVLFQGAYHGQSDQTLAIPDLSDPKAPAVPAGAGISFAAASDALVLPYGRRSALAAIRAAADDLAAVLVEPVQSRNPGLQPVEFLRELRALTEETGVPLIFDEIITGLRVHPQGAQGILGIVPDLSVYGKSLGGGMPVSAVAGRASLLDRLDQSPGEPLVPIGTTFDMQPLCLASAHAMLTRLVEEGPAFQRRLNHRTEQLCARLNEACWAASAPISIVSFGSLFRFVWKGNTSYFYQQREMEVFYLNLLDRGLYIWEGRTCFLSTAHNAADEDKVVAAVQDTLHKMANAGFFATEPEAEPASLPASPGCKEAERLSAGQQWMIALVERVGPEAPQWCVTECFDLEGTFDTDAFCEAVRRTVERHPGLRTVFEPEMGRQCVLPSLEPEIGILDHSGEGAAAAETAADSAVRRPFDLRRGPLLRVLAVRVGAQRWSVIITCQHVVSDSVSLAIIRDEIAERYSRRVLGQPDPEAGPAPAFDGIRTLREKAAATSRFDEARRSLADALSQTAPLPLPGLSGENRGCRSFRGQRLTRCLDSSSTDDILHFGRKRGLTTYMVLFAAFCLHLHAATGAARFVAGVPRAGRDARGTESVVGYCADLVPVISAINPAEPVARYLDRTRSILVEALRLPAGVLESILLARGADGKADPAPPFEVVFNLDPPVTPPHFEGLSARSRAAPSAFALVPYRLDAATVDGKFWLTVDYRDDLFDEAAISAWVRLFGSVLVALLDPDSDARPVGTLIAAACEQTDVVGWVRKPTDAVLTATTEHPE